MTEEEAKTKWCPFARVGVATNPTLTAANRDVDTSGGEPFRPKLFPAAFCVGSACMAWRKTYSTDAFSPPVEDGGYCGLAGTP